MFIIDSEKVENNIYAVSFSRTTTTHLLRCKISKCCCSFEVNWYCIDLIN